MSNYMSEPNRRTVLAAAAAAAAFGLAGSAQSQQAGVRRTDLLRHDLGVSGREVIQVRVDFRSRGGVPAA
jgi:hypothetical protein